jgi:hypothetical protein
VRQAHATRWRVNPVTQYRIQKWLEYVFQKIVRGLTAFSDASSIETRPYTVTTAKMHARKFSIPAGYAVKRRR